MYRALSANPRLGLPVEPSCPPEWDEQDRRDAHIESALPERCDDVARDPGEYHLLIEELARDADAQMVLRRLTLHPHEVRTENERLLVRALGHVIRERAQDLLERETA